jgi:hypothetical protein
METFFCCRRTAPTRTGTVPTVLIRFTTDDSMNVRLARAADERRKVSADRVFSDRSGIEKRLKS